LKRNAGKAMAAVVGEPVKGAPLLMTACSLVSTGIADLAGQRDENEFITMTT
jgi:hypothetical protein